MKDAVVVSDLKKDYKTYKRSEGLLQAIHSIFHREFVIKSALKGINFKIQEGEIMGLIGPNGAGKSTAIKTMCGILHPTSGRVSCLGYTPWKQRIEYAKYFGVVFGQKSQLEWDLPPNDTFHLIKTLYNVPDNRFNLRLDKMIRLLDVEHIYKTPTRDLSLGERMRCEVIAALLHNPKLVFLDEPTIGMDVVAKKKLHNFIKEVNRKYGTTFIITTHDMNDIEKLCKRVIIINKGEIVYDGLLGELNKNHMKKKQIEVKFEEKTKVKLPKKCRLVFETPYDLRFEIPSKSKETHNFLLKLIEKYPVADIVISDPEIEEIIRDIYER